MNIEQLRKVDLAELRDVELRQLIAAGETVAERKAAIPADGIGPTIAAFANAGGGWVLLGVRNDGTPCGFQVPGRSESQDWLRNKLRVEVDPLPPFASRTMTLDGRDIVVIRVEDSAETPHLVKATGAVLVREHGGKQPIGSQARLLELCMRPEEAEQRTIRRMTQLPLVTQALAARDVGPEVNGQTRVSDWMLVASPVSVPQGFRSRSLSRETIAAVRGDVLAKACRLGPGNRGVVDVKPRATGAVIDGGNLANGDGTGLCLDAGGVVVGYIRKRLTRGAWHVGATADEVVSPLLDLTLSALTMCGAAGRTLVHLYIRITPTAPDAPPSLAVYTAQSHGELHAPPGGEGFFGGDIALPTATGAREAFADQLMHEIARASGIEWWE